MSDEAAIDWFKQENESLQQRLAESEAERERLKGELAIRDAEVSKQSLYSVVRELGLAQSGMNAWKSIAESNRAKLTDAQSLAQRAEQERDRAVEALRKLDDIYRREQDLPLERPQWLVEALALGKGATPPPPSRTEEPEQLGKWAWSTNGEEYDGEPYDSPMEAAAVGFEYMADDLDEGRSIHVGMIVKPDVPGFIDANRIIEDITERECFDNDWADDWPNASKAQVDELSDRFHEVFVGWMNGHKLEPKWFTIEQDREITKEEVEAWKATLPNPPKNEGGDQA